VGVRSTPPGRAAAASLDIIILTKLGVGGDARESFPRIITTPRAEARFR